MILAPGPKIVIVYWCCPCTKIIRMHEIDAKTYWFFLCISTNKKGRRRNWRKNQEQVWHSLGQFMHGQCTFRHNLRTLSSSTGYLFRLRLLVHMTVTRTKIFWMREIRLTSKKHFLCINLQREMQRHFMYSSGIGVAQFGTGKHRLRTI